MFNASRFPPSGLSVQAREVDLVTHVPDRNAEDVGGVWAGESDWCTGVPQHRESYQLALLAVVDRVPVRGVGIGPVANLVQDLGRTMSAMLLSV
jgi:hypothetical protein